MLQAFLFTYILPSQFGVGAYALTFKVRKSEGMSCDDGEIRIFTKSDCIVLYRLLPTKNIAFQSRKRG